MPTILRREPSDHPHMNDAVEVVDLVVEDDRWLALDLASIAQQAARATLQHLGLAPDDYEIALLACDDARIAVLNGDFRDKPQPTNVLSWPSEERGAGVPGQPPDLPETPGELGDIAIAYDTCLREAEAEGRAISAHVCHLLIHGVLHLLGYDHMTNEDADLMERLEVEILATLGHADPY